MSIFPIKNQPITRLSGRYGDGTPEIRHLSSLVRNFLASSMQGLRPRNAPVVEIAPIERIEATRTTTIRGVVNIQAGFAITLADDFLAKPVAAQEAEMRVVLEAQLGHLRSEILRKIGDPEQPEQPDFTPRRAGVFDEYLRKEAERLHERAIRELYTPAGEFWGAGRVLGQFPDEEPPPAEPAEVNEVPIPPMPFEKEA